VAFLPGLGGKEFLQIHFYFRGVGVLAQPQPARNARNVRIHREGQTAPQVHADNTGCFFAHTRQGFQLGALGGHLRRILSHQNLGHGDKVFGLVAEQPQRVDIGGHLGLLGHSIALRMGKALK